MGVTLEQLLDSSGIASMGDEEEVKTASLSDARDDGDDIVSALRKFASSTDEEDMREEAFRELTEKTAEIAVIAKTLSDIDRLANLGVQDEDQTKLASFVKVALDRGHSEEEIAQFLKEAGPVSWAASKLRGVRRAAGRSGGAVESRAIGGDVRSLRKALVGKSPNEQLRVLKEMEGSYGKDVVGQWLTAIKEEGTRIPAVAYEYLPKAVRSKSVRVGIGEKGFNVSKQNLERGGMVGAGLGTGAVMSGGRGDSKKSKRGVVVVNS